MWRLHCLPTWPSDHLPLRLFFLHSLVHHFLYFYQLLCLQLTLKREAAKVSQLCQREAIVYHLEMACHIPQVPDDHMTKCMQSWNFCWRWMPFWNFCIFLINYTVFLRDRWLEGVKKDTSDSSALQQCIKFTERVSIIYFFSIYKELFF